MSADLPNPRHNPHRFLAGLVLRHPEWAITYVPPTRGGNGAYVARRPLAARHRAMGMTEETITATDTVVLADMLAQHDALRAGIDYLTQHEGACLAQATDQVVEGFERLLRSTG